MNTKLLHRIFGAVVLVVSLMTYGLTVQPTVPFWDCGEFTAATAHQQVPHPPGAPLFLMVGKLFHMLPIGNPDDTGIRVNFVSVMASAITVWLLYLTLVMVINAFRKKGIETMADAFMVFGSALVGALAFNFSDTFWFNGVESEVYASSSLFVQIVVYMMMRWWEEADNPGHERYLLVIAYLLGLSIGVHLLALLGIFSIVYLVYFRRYKFTNLSFVIASAVSLVTFVVIYKMIIFWMPTLMAGNLPIRNKILEYTVQDELWVRVLAVLIVVAAIVGVFYGYTKKITWMSLLSSAFVLVLMGYTTYTHLLLRAQANPPMDENSPKTFASLLSYIGREQYGEAPILLPRRYETRDQEKIRLYKNYGKWYEPTDVPVTRKDGREITIPEVTKLNMAGELNYLWSYQIYQMYIRYFFWNFVGRSSDLQDSPAAFFSSSDAEIRNFNSGYKNLFPIRFFALPLLFGMIGLFFHFKADPKMAWVYLVMFLMMGVFAAIAQNQQNPQPRERDYFYCGSFMVWCIWIGLGVYALIEFAAEKMKSYSLSPAIVLASVLLVPANMAIGGWKMHDRSGNYLPYDYCYNILQSCAKDAILFTNGDNDTFPVWYLQDVDGVRTDIRCVNLSLGNTLWYIEQLKNREPWGAKKIPLSFPDESLLVDENNDKALTYSLEKAKRVSIPVDKEIMAQYTSDSSLINAGQMNFVFNGEEYTKDQDGTPLYLDKVQDKLILDILQTTRFTRPLYFSTTAGYPGSATFVGLSDFVRLEGMAYKICPVRQRGGLTGMSVNEEVMDQCLMHPLADNESYKVPHYGFKLRDMNNSGVYYDEHHRNYLDSYRRIYMQYANYLIEEKRNISKAVAVLDKLMEMISIDQFPMSYIDMMNVSTFYQDCQQYDKAKKFAQLVKDRCTQIVDKPEKAKFENGAGSRDYPIELYLADAAVALGDKGKALEALQLYTNKVGPNPRVKFRQDLMDVRLQAAAGHAKEALAAAQAFAAHAGPEASQGVYMQEMMKLMDDLQLQSGQAATMPQM